jgi:hypothetical protein
MSATLKHTLRERAGGNYRVMTNMAAQLLAGRPPQRRSHPATIGRVVAVPLGESSRACLTLSYREDHQASCSRSPCGIAGKCDCHYTGHIFLV